MAVNLLICGSRDIPDSHDVQTAISHMLGALCVAMPVRTPDVVISGGDTDEHESGMAWAFTHGATHTLVGSGWSANQEMVDKADAVIAIRYPDSRGTNDTLKKALRKGIPTVVLTVPRGTR